MCAGPENTPFGIKVKDAEVGGFSSHPEHLLSVMGAVLWAKVQLG
jgi:hypothetical protein